MQGDTKHRGFTGSQSNVKHTFNQNRNISTVNYLHYFLQPQDNSQQNENTSENLTTQQVLWGTSINIHEVNAKIRSFFLGFKDLTRRESEKQLVYFNCFNEILESQIRFLTIEGVHIYEYDK